MLLLGRSALAIPAMSASLNSFDFSTLKRLPMALYWCLPERDIPRLRPLTSMFFTKLFDDLGGEANPYSNQSQQDGGQANVPVTILADEFANIGKVPNFDSVITLARSKNVALILGLQSYAQLKLRYGLDAAQVILDSCATKIVLHGLDYESAERISRTLGDQTQVIDRQSVSRRNMFEPQTVTSHQTEHGRRLLQANEIRQIGVDQMIVISGNRPPYGSTNTTGKKRPAPRRRRRWAKLARPRSACRRARRSRNCRRLTQH
jgi:type IV secretory pathway TraG/TraD family ATPase VirD4